MLHNYEKNWMDANALEMPANQECRCFALDFPRAAALTKVIVRQLTGTDTAFTVNIYNRAVCRTGELISSGSSISCPTPTDELANAIPTQRMSVPGGVMELFHPQGYTFRNMDQTTFSTSTKKLYLELVLDNYDEDSTWEVSIACRPEI